MSNSATLAKFGHSWEHWLIYMMCVREHRLARPSKMLENKACVIYLHEFKLPENPTVTVLKR